MLFSCNWFSYFSSLGGLKKIETQRMEWERVIRWWWWWDYDEEYTCGCELYIFVVFRSMCCVWCLRKIFHFWFDLLKKSRAATIYFLREQYGCEITLQHRILNRIEYHLNIFRVHGIREMMIDGRSSVPADAHEHLQYKILDVKYRMRIPRELWIEPTNVRVRVFHFGGKQIRFVQKQNDGDILEGGIIYNCIEDIFRFFETICFPIFIIIIIFFFK